VSWLRANVMGPDQAVWGIADNSEGSIFRSMLVLGRTAGVCCRSPWRALEQCNDPRRSSGGAERYACVAYPSRGCSMPPTASWLPVAVGGQGAPSPPRSSLLWIFTVPFTSCIICCCRPRNIERRESGLVEKIKFVLCELTHTYLMSGRREYEFEGELMLCSTPKLDTGTTLPRTSLLFLVNVMCRISVFCVTVATTLLATVPLSAQLPPSPSSLSSLSSRGCSSGMLGST